MFVEVFVDITSYNDVMRMFVFQIYFMKLIYALLIFDLDPLLPVSLPRGYGGVAILWKKPIDYLVRTLPDGSEKIQCIELEGAKRNVIIICVYMPANGSS
jgi:hypothetical protein